MFVNHTCFWVY